MSETLPPPITSDTLLPHLLSEYPATREVFDLYGLRGCGGLQGPNEKVGWFARLHGVPVDNLLEELAAAAAKSGALAYESTPSVADTIYRPFFLAGIATVLTLGCVWGAINLLTIGLTGSFNAVNYSWILAHGHAMVFGFVGFFIMGFAYQAFPRFKHTSLWRPQIAILALPLMAVGIVQQTIAHLLSPPSLFLEMVAATFQLVSILVFATAIIMTARRAKKPESFDRFVYSALAWFVVAAVANPVIFKLFELPANREELLFSLASFNIPYRDVQLLGIAVVMILGVSLRLLPQAYGFREPSQSWQSFLFWSVNGSILAGIAFFIAGMAGGNHWLLTIHWVTTVILLIAAIGTPVQYRLFAAVPESERDRGLKFIRAAYGWFIVATAMLVFTPIYNFVIYMPITGSRSPFSHAFFGAYRHALTVGFIMMMIVGVSSKIVPTLSGLEIRLTRSLWLTFILLNVGNLTRVSFQIATDFWPPAYRVMGISGFIEVVGLTLWGYELFANMRAGRKLRTDFERILDITPATKVGDVLTSYPQSLEIFLRRGFTPLKNAMLRNTVARAITIEQACRRERVDMNELLNDLRDMLGNKRMTSAQIVSITRGN